MTNTYTKSFSDGSALTEAQLNTGFTTVKPSLSNMALATTGSSSFQVLRSAGSATAPEWDDVGDILANGVTAAGANAVLAVVTSVSSTQANLIGNALDSSAAANNILAQVDSVSSTQANLVAQAVTRTTGTSVAALGIAISNSSGFVQISSTSPTDITNLNVTITTTGRPVVIAAICVEGQTCYLGVEENPNSGTGEVGIECKYSIVRDTSTIASYSISAQIDNSIGTAVGAKYSPGLIYHVDTPSAGTYTYKMQGWRSTGGVLVNEIALMAYEL